MSSLKIVALAALAVTTIDTATSSLKAAPLPTHVVAMQALLDTPAVQVRYGRWYGGAYRGWGGWGYRGYRGWGAAAAGAVVGGAIARTAYYGGAYPYYGAGYPYAGSYAYSGGYASDYCSPYGYYPRYTVGGYYGDW